MTKENYSKFMSNKENIYNCENCPMNEGFENVLPCGQYNCWVEIHCNDSDEYEDEEDDFYYEADEEDDGVII